MPIAPLDPPATDCVAGHRLAKLMRTAPLLAFLEDLRSPAWTRPPDSSISLLDSPDFADCLLLSCAVLAPRTPAFRLAYFCALLVRGANPFARGMDGRPVEWEIESLEGEEKAWFKEELDEAKRRWRERADYEFPEDVHQWIKDELDFIWAWETAQAEEQAAVESDQPSSQDVDMDLDGGSTTSPPPTKRPRVEEPLPDYIDGEPLLVKPEPVEPSLARLRGAQGSPISWSFGVPSSSPGYSAWTDTATSDQPAPNPDSSISHLPPSTFLVSAPPRPPSQASLLKHPAPPAPASSSSSPRLPQSTTTPQAPPRLSLLHPPQAFSTSPAQPTPIVTRLSSIPTSFSPSLTPAVPDVECEDRKPTPAELAATSQPTITSPAPVPAPAKKSRLPLAVLRARLPPLSKCVESPQTRSPTGTPALQAQSAMLAATASPQAQPAPVPSSSRLPPPQTIQLQAAQPQAQPVRLAQGPSTSRLPPTTTFHSSAPPPLYSTPSLGEQCQQSSAPSFVARGPPVTVELRFLPSWLTQPVLRHWLLHGPAVFQNISPDEVSYLELLIDIGGPVPTSAANVPPVPVDVVVDEHMHPLQPNQKQQYRRGRVTYSTNGDAERARRMFNGQKVVKSVVENKETFWMK
ncbi:hypothetical protein JCM5296_006625 [Sporobolomyces johnsonii]